MKIAIDAMGGDTGPGVIIEGAIDYLRDYHKDIGLTLVGKEKEIKKELRKNNSLGAEKIEIVNALEAVSMREQFFSYWRKRERTSIKKALDLVKQKKAQAMVSAGNTGAVMAIAKTVLGMLKSIDRPALAVMIPTLKSNALLVDVGANVDSTPKNLVQFALMGKVYLEAMHGIKRPRIGLMSVGEEDVKGNELTKVTHNLLKSLDINFVGNVEGKDVYAGETDLIVTDGFTGNIMIKVSEGVISAMHSMLKRETMSDLLARVGFFFLKSSLRRLKKKLDYTEYGGALLLGVNGIVIIGHGRSSKNAVKNAINLSKEFIRGNILTKISREIDSMQGTFKELKYV
ncbi:MAG: phosphate acyltransferase PlsX [Candidatus Aminicenantes bacterium]|nr:phosphate acyltransferase PlsX [Candidatus Aminicenantes bacterium]